MLDDKIEWNRRMNEILEAIAQAIFTSWPTHSAYWLPTVNRQETTTSVQDQQRAFKITGLTWIVERSFAWLGRNRRLSKDYEYRVQTSETMIDLAAIRLMLNRIALPETFQTPSKEFLQ